MLERKSWRHLRQQNPTKDKQLGRSNPGWTTYTSAWEHCLIWKAAQVVNNPTQKCRPLLLQIKLLPWRSPLSWFQAVVVIPPSCSHNQSVPKQRQLKEIGTRRRTRSSKGIVHLFCLQGMQPGQTTGVKVTYVRLFDVCIYQIHWEINDTSVFEQSNGGWSELLCN